MPELQPERGIYSVFFGKIRISGGAENKTGRFLFCSGIFMLKKNKKNSENPVEKTMEKMYITFSER